MKRGVNMVRVSKEEYQEYIKTCSDITHVDISGISEPPAINHYDKDHNLKAHTFDYDAGYYPTPEEKREYYIDK